MSNKQSTIIDYIREHGTATFDEIASIFEYAYYHNYKHHVGNILKNMVLKGTLVRVQRGVYALGAETESKIILKISPNQIGMDL